MKNRSSAVLLIACLSATPLLAEAAAERPAGRVMIVHEPSAPAAHTVAQRPSIMRMPIAQASGSVVAPVDESFDHLFVAQTDANGNVVIVCTDDHEAAAAGVSSSSEIPTVLRLRPRLVMKNNSPERE
jgi:hypothetical protein